MPHWDVNLQVFFLPFNMAFANAMVTLFVFDTAEFVRECLWEAVRIGNIVVAWLQL